MTISVEKYTLQPKKGICDGLFFFFLKCDLMFLPQGVSGPLKLELQALVSCHMGIGS